MPSWPDRPVLHAAAAALLGAVILWRGLLPAARGPETDFQNYYTASRLLLEGAPMERCYDHGWFQQQMIRFGCSGTGKFSPFPPPTVLVMTPVAWMAPERAFLAWTVVNLLALGGCILLVRSLTGLHPATACLLVLAAGLAIINGLRFGQMYILLSLLILLALRWIRQGKEIPAGLAAGVMIPIKYFPVVMVLWFLIERRWRAAGAAVLAAAAVTALTAGIAGPGMFGEFFAAVLPEHLQARYALQSPYASAFQSWDSLLMRLFVMDPTDNPGAVTDSPLLYRIASTMITGAGILLTLLGAIRAGRSPRLRELVPGVLGTGALLFAPGTATYHFVLLWPVLVPVVLHLRAAAEPPDHSSPPGPARLILLLYAAIGWIPYGWFRAFESSGGIGVILAYPRLFLLLAFFSLLLTVVYRYSRGGEPIGAAP